MDSLTDKDVYNRETDSKQKTYETGSINQLTKWENQPTIEDIKADLEEAQPFHDAHVAEVENWLDNMHIRGKAKPKTSKGRSSVQPKLIRKQAEWRYASLSEPFLSPEDLFTASPATSNDSLAAKQNGILLNYQIRNHVDFTKFIDDYVRTGVDEGTIVCRTSWERIEKEVTKTEPIYEFMQDPSKENIDNLQMLSRIFNEYPDRFAQLPERVKEAFVMSQDNGVPISSIQVGEEEVKKTILVKNSPTVEVCDYDDVVIDPTCRGDLSKAKFIFFRFPTSKSDLKEKGIYSNLDSIVLEEANVLSVADQDADSAMTSFSFNDDARKEFYAYEYWAMRDIDNTGTLTPIVGTYVGNTIIRMEENPYPDGSHPFISVQYLPRRNEIRGESDGVLIEDNQQIVGAVTRGMIDVMAKSANGQQGSRKDALDPVNKRKFDRGDDYEFNPQVDPRQAFYMHVYPEIPVSAQYMLNLNNNEAESMTGVKAFGNGGLSGESLGDTATGIRGALDAASKRELGILRRLAKGITKIGYKFMAMNAEWLEEEEVVRITEEQFVPIIRDELGGKVDLKLSITTAEEDNAKAAELAFMMQTAGPNTDPGESRMIRAEIARLRKMPELAKRIEEYRPEPDPVQQQLQQIQLQNAMLENEKLKSEIQENYANAALDNAKSRESNSKADLSNLDFLEQESGTKHERDVNKITSQAKAQTGMKVVEKQLEMLDRANNSEE